MRIPILMKRLGIVVVSFSMLMSAPFSSMAAGSAVPILQPTTVDKVEGSYYLPSTVDTIRWGYLPNRDSKPSLTIPSGSTVTIDTVSHEGMLEDQGRDPVKFFGSFGVSKDEVLDDVKAIAYSGIKHDFDKDGPHIVTGPIAIDGAKPGDVLKVEILTVTPRVPYGINANRHDKGALPGEFPENEGPKPGASAQHPELYNNVFKFIPVKNINGKLYGTLPVERGGEARFPLKPFMGVIGTAANTSERLSSVPPIETGGNMDNNELGVGSTLYLPVQVKGGLFFTGDPHYVQGDAEVSGTGLEASLRGTFRITVLKKGDPSIPIKGDMKRPFAETEDFWIPIGLDPDLNLAMKDAVRQGIQFLNEKLGMDRATAYAYMSDATDFVVTQVVDKTKGIHGLINKRHFLDNLKLSVSANGKNIKSEIVNNDFYVSLPALTESLGGHFKWDRTKQIALVTIGSNQISVQIGQPTYKVNGKFIDQNNAAILRNQLVFIPMKEVSDIFGAKVNWTTSGNTLHASVTNVKKK